MFALKINTEDFCIFPVFFINFQVSTKSFMLVIHLMNSGKCLQI